MLFGNLAYQFLICQIAERTFCLNIRSNSADIELIQKHIKHFLIFHLIMLFFIELTKIQRKFKRNFRFGSFLVRKLVMTFNVCSKNIHRPQTATLAS